MRRIDQDMATTAAGLLPEATGDNAKELRSRFRHLPVQLHGSGLAATYAFIAARSNSASSERLTQAYRDVARQIRAHLADKGLLHESLVSAEEPGVHRETLSALGDMDWATYARAGREVAVLFSWLRKLADAVYPSTKPPANRSAGGGDRGARRRPRLRVSRAGQGSHPPTCRRGRVPVPPYPLLPQGGRPYPERPAHDGPGPGAGARAVRGWQLSAVPIPEPPNERSCRCPAAV